MEILKATESYLEKLTEFYDNVIIYLNNHINYPKWKYKIYPALVTILHNIRKESQFICIDNKEIIGAFVLNNDSEGNYKKANWSMNLAEGEYMVIHAFAISPNHYRLGLGTKLLKYAISYAKENCYKGIRLDVVPTNYPARNLYLKNGFKYIGDLDIDRCIEDIPEFSLFELYW